MSVEAATEADLAKLPDELRESAQAAAALELARGMDAGNSLTSKSMAAKAHSEIMERLRELAPPAVRKDKIDELSERRNDRRSTRTKAKKRS